MLVGINCGHTKTGPGSGAVGLINESTESRNVGYKVMDKLKKRGANVVDCTIDKASSQSECLRLITAQANRQDLDYFISIHFNAGRGKGVEVYTYKGRQFQDAVDVCINIEKLGFVNRGVKNGTGLYVVGKTKAKSMLIEVCFVDSSDANLYLKLGADKIASAIADAIIEDVKKEEIKPNKNYAILYSNEADRVGAEIISWGIPNSNILYLNEYKGSGYWGVICVGGKTETELKAKYPNINYTSIKGNDRFDTARKSLGYINRL